MSPFMQFPLRDLGHEEQWGTDNNKTLYIACMAAYFYIKHTKNLFHVEILMDIISYNIIL